MEIHYHKILKDSATGKSVAKLLDEISVCDKKADKLAMEVGACAYLADNQADYGGIAAFQFPETHIINKTLWDEVLIDDTKEKYYIPKAKITQKFIEAEKAEEYRNNPKAVISRIPIPFNQIMINFSREEAAIMAGVKLTTPPIEKIGKKHGISRKILNMIAAGIRIEEVCPDIPEDIARDLRLSVTEDNEILSAMKDKRFVHLSLLEGPQYAINIYRKMQDLPAIPNGTVNSLLGVKSSQYRCGILDCGTYIQITSPEPLNGADMLPSDEMEFQAAMLYMNEKNKRSNKLLN